MQVRRFKLSGMGFRVWRLRASKPSRFRTFRIKGSGFRQGLRLGFLASGAWSSRHPVLTK